MDRQKHVTVRDILAQIEGDDSEMDISTDGEQDDLDQDPDFALTGAPDCDGAQIDQPEPDDSESEIDSDDEPLSRIATASGAANCKKNPYSWRNTDFQPTNVAFTGQIPEPPEDAVIKTPIEYFRRFMTDDMMELTAEQTNIYSLQTKGRCVNTNKKELEQLMGMYLKMGIVQMPGIRVYWEKDTRYGPVSDVMSTCRNRFQALLTSIHFVDNETVLDEQKKDKLWKLRPLLDMFKSKCRLITPGEHQSIVDTVAMMGGA